MSDDLEAMRLALIEARQTIINLATANAENTERLQMEIARMIAENNNEDKALLDWADQTGHHDVSYRNLRDELRDQAKRMPFGIKPAANAAETAIARRVMLERLNLRKSTMTLDDYTTIQRFIGTVV